MRHKPELRTITAEIAKNKRLDALDGERRVPYLTDFTSRFAKAGFGSLQIDLRYDGEEFQGWQIIGRCLRALQAIPQYLGA